MNAKRRNAINSIINDLIDKFEEIKAEAIDQLSEIRDEEQEAFDNLPEALQDSERGENMQDCIDALDSFISDLEDMEIEGTDDLIEEIGG